MSGHYGNTGYSSFQQVYSRHLPPARPLRGALRNMQRNRMGSLIPRSALAGVGHVRAQPPPRVHGRRHQSPTGQCHGGRQPPIRAACQPGSRDPRSLGEEWCWRREGGGSSSQLTCDRDKTWLGGKETLAPVWRELTPWKG